MRPISGFYQRRPMIGVHPRPKDLSDAERLACQYEAEDVSDWDFRRPILDQLPSSFANLVAKRFSNTNSTIDY